MDQKHSMLFSDLDTIGNQTHERYAACASMGLPVEVPPPYDTNNMRAISQRTIHLPAKDQNYSETLSTDSPRLFRPSTIPIVIEQTSFTLPCYTHSIDAAADAANYHQRSNILSDMSMTPPQPKLGPNPCTIVCPACGIQNSTHMTHTPNSRTHAYAVALCLFGWCCLACCLPYWMKSCRTGNHYCAECNTFLGAYYPYHNNEW